MRLLCPKNLVEELITDDSTLATTINTTGVVRLARDWLTMKAELNTLRNQDKDANHDDD